MSYLIVGIVCLMVGFVIGVYFDKYGKKPIGAFVVDPYNPEFNGGVYTVFDIDPLKLHDKQVVAMDVIVADVSQENQGT